MDKTPPMAKPPLPTESNVKEVKDTTGDRLSLLKSRLTISKTWCEKPHKAWKKWIGEYNIDDFGDTEEVRDKVRIGYVFRKTESTLPSIFDDQPDLFFKGRNPNIKDIEPLIDGTYDYLWDAQDLEEKIEDLATYAEVIGMAFISSPWYTKTKKVPQPVVDPATQQPTIDSATGQPAMQLMEVPVVDRPDAIVEDPFKVFFSPETKFGPVMDYKHCPGYFIERVATVEEIKARFGKDVDAQETLDLKDSDTDDEIDGEITRKGDLVKSDMKRVTYFEYYGCLPQDSTKGIKDDQGGDTSWTYDKDYHVFFTKNEELKAEECPYDVKPLFILGGYGLANKFWKFGTAKHLMPLIQEYEMYRSQVLEHTRKGANPKPLIPTESDVDEKAFRDPRPGTIVKFANGAPPTYLQPAALGREVEVGINVVKEDLEKESGSFDLAGGAGQSTVKTPKGIEVYSEAADKNVRRKRKKIARVLRQLIIFQFGQIAMFWKPEDGKTIEIMGAPEQVTAEVLQVLDYLSSNRKLDIETESLSVNKVQMKQDALNLWESCKEFPQYFNLGEVAKDLLQNGYGKKDADRYLITDQQRQAMSKPQPEQPKVSVSIKADATTPPGAALLEQEGLLPQGVAEKAVIDNQVMNHIVGQNQNAQQMDQMKLKGDQAQAQTFTQNAFKGNQTGGGI